MLLKLTKILLKLTKINYYMANISQQQSTNFRQWKFKGGLSVRMT